jgi:DNA-binding ferritin-like protein (Dps family)
MLKKFFLFTIFCIPIISSAKFIKKVSPNQIPIILKVLEGKYDNCDVVMGNARGKGSIIMGNITNFNRKDITLSNEFSFNIFVLGRNDMQFGKMRSLEIETNNFNDYLFRIQWFNNRQDQGTISAEIQIFYSHSKQKYETYFLNNSSSDFKIFWWSELNSMQKDILKKQINLIFQSDFKKIEKLKNKYKYFSNRDISYDCFDLDNYKIHGEFANNLINEFRDQNNDFETNVSKQRQIHLLIDTVIRFYYDLKNLYGDGFNNYNYYVGRLYFYKIINFRDVLLDQANKRIIDPVNYKKNKDSAYHYLNKHLQYEPLHADAMNRLSRLVWYDNIWRQVLKGAYFNKEVYLKSLNYLFNNILDILRNSKPDDQESIDIVCEIVAQMIIDQLGDFNYPNNDRNRINQAYILGRIMKRLRNLDNYNYFEIENYEKKEKLIDSKIQFATDYIKKLNGGRDL